jgi:hypothetical protein
VWRADRERAKKKLTQLPDLDCHHAETTRPPAGR